VTNSTKNKSKNHESGVLNSMILYHDI